MYTQSILILAEAALADNDLNGAKSLLKTLLTLVRNHPMATDINDQLEGRYNGGDKGYPNCSEYRVAASSEDEFRGGLVLDRQAPHLISVLYHEIFSIIHSLCIRGVFCSRLMNIVLILRNNWMSTLVNSPVNLG